MNITELEKNEAVCSNLKHIIYSFLKEKNIYYYNRLENSNLYLKLGNINPNKQNIEFTNDKSGIPVYLSKKDNKISVSTRVKNLVPINASSSIQIDEICNILDIVVTGYKLSGKIFGKAEAKSELVNKTFKNGSYYIDYGNSKKLGEETYYVGVPFTETVDGELVKKHIKFVVSEIEFRLPDIKGYSIPKDKTIRKGDKVNLIHDRLGEPWLVIEVHSDSTSKKISRSSENRKKDVISIYKHGILKRVFAQNLRKI